MVRGPVRDPRRVRRRPGPAVRFGRRGDRGARPERGRGGGASRGCRRHPREVRRPGEALAAQGESRDAPWRRALEPWWRKCGIRSAHRMPSVARFFQLVAERTRNFFTNWREYDGPVGRKLALTFRNRARAI